MNRRALLVAFHFPPQAASSGIQRTLSFSKHLSKHGWDPLVLSAMPIAYSLKNPSQLRALPSDLIVRRAFALDAKRHMGILGRYPELLALPDRWSSWWLAAVPAGLSMIRQHAPTVIWSTFPIASAALIGLTLHRLTGLPWIADFRDPMLQNGYPATALQRKTYKWIEEKTIHHCQKAIFTTHSAMNSYKHRFPEELHEKFTVIENGYDEESFGIPTFVSGADHRGSDRRLTLLHSGTLYADDRDPSAFFEAISLLKTKGKVNSAALRVVLRATGDDNYFNSLIKKYDIADIICTAPSIPYTEALDEMLKADGLIVFQGSSVNAQIPAKLYEYLRARTPILGLLDPTGEAARLLGNAGIPDISPMNSVGEIASALERFINRIREGSARIATDDFIASLSREHRAADLARLLDEVAGSHYV